jgi:hypothetical protein
MENDLIFGGHPVKENIKRHSDLIEMNKKLVGLVDDLEVDSITQYAYNINKKEFQKYMSRHGFKKINLKIRRLK